MVFEGRLTSATRAKTAVVQQTCNTVQFKRMCVLRFASGASNYGLANVGPAGGQRLPFGPEAPRTPSGPVRLVLAKCAPMRHDRPSIPESISMGQLHRRPFEVPPEILRSAVDLFGDPRRRSPACEEVEGALRR